MCTKHIIILIVRKWSQITFCYDIKSTELVTSGRNIMINILMNMLMIPFVIA